MYGCTHFLKNLGATLKC